MNLGRAKSILIIAFAGLNLFLGYHLFWPDVGRLTRVAVTAEELSITETMLNENNFFLRTTIDRSARVSDFLSVTPDRNLQGEILQSFIKKGARVVESDGTTAYRTDEETSLVYTSGLIRVIYEPGVLLVEGTAGLEEQQIREHVEEFLNDAGLIPEGIVYDYMEKSDAGYLTLHYYQAYEDKPIYASQLAVTIESDRVSTVQIYWLQPVERVTSREIEVTPATEALAKLVDELGPSSSPRDITALDLGYFSGEYDAEKWEMPPVWRIVLDGKEHYYINAFTGNIEQDSVIPEQLP